MPNLKFKNISQIAIITTAIFFNSGCKTLKKIESKSARSVLPPEPLFVNKWKNASLDEIEQLPIASKESNILWWKTYILSSAKKNSAPAEACSGFKSLAQDQDFPLKDLALLRAWQICSDTQVLPALPSESNPWYKDISTEIKLNTTLKSQDLKKQALAYLEKAQAETNKKTKEDFLLKALALAEKLSEDKGEERIEKKNEIQNKVPKEKKNDIPLTLAENLTEKNGSQSEIEDLKKQILSALYKNSPRLNPLPNFKELSAVALDFRFHRDFQKALAVYQKILTSPEVTTEDTFQTLKNIRMTYKVMQKQAEYIQATKELVSWTEKQFKANKKDRKNIARYHDAQLLLARTLWTEDQSTLAMKILEKTLSVLNNLYPMDEVYYLISSMEEEKKNFTKALEHLEAAYKQPVSVPNLRQKLVWLKSWNYFKQENWVEAQKSFEEMKTIAKDPADTMKARFWLARTLKQLRQDAASVAELETLIKEDPLGYYAVLAYRELGRPYPAVKQAINDPARNQNLSLLQIQSIEQRSRMTLEWLIAVNEKAAAEKGLNEIAEKLKAAKITSEDTWLAVASSYARAGLYLPLFSTLSTLQVSVKDHLLNDHPELLFPRPYGDIVADASGKSEIPREFIYSIIRQESAFNPEARSAVDAFGLMQLLPSVSKTIATKHNLPFNEVTDLYKPEINIPLGAFELKNLMKKYNDQYILAVSGYNANDKAIRGWLATRLRQDPVEFIEEIPYEETRTYIKLTMRNYVFYRRLLSPEISINFPEELLRLGRQQ